MFAFISSDGPKMAASDGTDIPERRYRRWARSLGLVINVLLIVTIGATNATANRVPHYTRLFEWLLLALPIVTTLLLSISRFSR